MGSSASVAVTWATVVPAGGRMGITQSELAQAAVPVDGEIKWLCHSPAGSVCLAQRGERWKWKRRREGGRGEVGLEEGDVDKGGWGGGGAAPAFHSSVRLCRCVRQPPQPYSDVSLAIHLPLNFSPSHSDSVPPLYLSHLPPFFSPPTVSFSSPCLATISSSLSLSAPLVFIILFFSPFFPESTLSFLSHGRGFISYFQSNLPPFHFPLFPESNALWFITSEILRRKKQITYKLKW